VQSSQRCAEIADRAKGIRAAERKLDQIQLSAALLSILFLSQEAASCRRSHTHFLNNNNPLATCGCVRIQGYHQRHKDCRDRGGP